MGETKRSAVVGAGPVGLLAAYLLAERGHHVALIDPDPGPQGDEPWRRRGVMQFWHPHLYRNQVHATLHEHAPALLHALFRAGVEVLPPFPGDPDDRAGLAARRPILEAALRAGVLAHPRVTHVPGTALRVRTTGGRVSSVTTTVGEVETGVVIGAVGRKSGLAEDLRPPVEGGSCGQSYVTRMYRAVNGHRFDVTPPQGAQCRDYQTIVFLQDEQTISVLFVRPAGDPEYRMLWQAACFDAAAAAVPNTAPWVDPERFEPITAPMRGGTLTNTYRRQGDLPAGLGFIGDAVCTTNPSAGRGITLGMWGAVEAVRQVVERAGADELAPALDAWSAEQVRPWYDDHVVTDAWTARRYAGDESIDIDAPLPSGVMAAAAFDDDPELLRRLGPFFFMDELPSVLPAHEPLVKARLRAGWTPAYAPGPTRDELVDIMHAAQLQPA